MSKVHLPKGMRDLLPHNMLRRNLVIKKIKKIFEEFGFYLWKHHRWNEKKH